MNLKKNPFKVFTPEGMDAKDANDLFVTVPGFNKIRDPGHTMLNGPRGCGKSMIFRYLMPDCQCLQSNVRIKELDFLGILVSIKNTAPNLTEFARLEDQHSKIILNEHVLTSFVATKLFEALSSIENDALPGEASMTREFFSDAFLGRLRFGGWKGNVKLKKDATVSEILLAAKNICIDVYQTINNYAKHLSFSSREVIPYTGALCDYLNFLYPLLNDLRSLPFIPDGPIYLLIDDADYLSHIQTRILNSWVATRTQQSISIKISTQLRYKTYSTVSGFPIQTPHDFQEINIADVYTSRKSKYSEKVEEILKKRLTKAGIDVPLREFFPDYKKQEKLIDEIGKKIREEWKTEGRGHRPGDDVTRYARPEYIKQLGGSSKGTSKYRYAGFDQLVHISSGLIRYFLEPAAQMFDEERGLVEGKAIKCIRPKIQDEVIRQESENLMFTEFDKMAGEDPQEDLEGSFAISRGNHQKGTEQLRNLIRSLGGTFYRKLVSSDAERRVFSVAISGTPDPEIVDVLNLGVRYGYFHRSSIGNKDGTGRTRLYVLTRRLAPHFNLDPSSFAGYLWITNEFLREGMANPDKVLRRIKKDGFPESLDSGQLTLF